MCMGTGETLLKIMLCIDDDDLTTGEACVYLSHNIVDVEQPLKLRNGWDTGRRGYRAESS